MSLKKKIPLKQQKRIQHKREKKEQLSIHDRLIFSTSDFLTDLECIVEMFEVVLPTLEQKDKTRGNRVEEILKSLKSRMKKKDNGATKTPLLTKVTELIMTLRKLHRAKRLFRQNAIVMMVSEYDQFLGDVFKAFFRATPDRLKSPDKTLSYDEILQLGSIKNAIEKFISKEIDQLFRGSHSEQIGYLEKQLKLNIREGLSCWSTFIELTERRNLFVHLGGQVSQQYIRVCKTHGVTIDEKLKEGMILSANEQYLRKAYKCLLEVSLKVSQSVLRKVWPDKLEDADVALNNIGFNFLESEQWELARMVFDFALTLPHKLISNEFWRKIFIINKCITLKWSGDENGMLKLLNEVDWSATDSKFTLGVHVLKNEYKQAESIMAAMNSKEPIKEYEFRTWPIFRDFRNTDSFRRAYKKIYGKEFRIEIPESATKTIDQHREHKKQKGQIKLDK
ncbi:hypothetical protein KAS42_01110 [bacterium]|nr:hypothetical protein [bacterium]